MMRFLFITCILFISWVPHSMANISGKPTTIDGDTIEIAGQRIRLHGIDTPEKGQVCEVEGMPWQCGQEATVALADAIGRTWVDCIEQNRDRYGRVVAVCRFGGPDGRDIGAYMVEEGWALAYRKYSMDYVPNEDAAKAAGKGLWRGDFVTPWDWRGGKRHAIETVNENRRCSVKGNIGKRGARIYHIPGSANYRRTRISETKGERWFCSEEEARAAGWRRSMR